MTTSLNEPIEFLDIVANRGTWNDNTVQARRTACKKFFDILEENEKTVEYVSDNLDVIKARYMNLNKDAAGTTVDEYGRRVKLVLDEFAEWKADRTGWEKKHAAKQSARPAGDGEKKPKTEKVKPQERTNGSSGINGGSYSNSRTVTFPIRPDFDLTITLPRDGLKVAELKKLLYFLLPYAQDWEPSQSPRSVFNMLEGEAS